MNTAQGNATEWSYYSPETAYQITVSTHVLAGALAIMCWDILNNLANDYRLLFKYQVRLPTVVYFLSRRAALGYMVAAALAETAPIPRCEELQRATSWMYTVCISTTSLLFFFRVRAVWNGNKYVIWFFSVMWLGVVGSALTAPHIIFATNIGSTRYCTTGAVKPFAVVTVIVPLVNDTLVLLAVTVGFVMNTHLEPTLKRGMRTVMYGDYLPAFSRAMLRDNQMYYLATVGCSLLTVVMFYANTRPGVYSIIFIVPNTMLMNVMACRVYRNTKLGNQWTYPSVHVSSIAFQEPNAKSGAARALGILSENGNQAVCIKGGRAENADVMDIYLSNKDETQDESRRGESAA
ncbi:hypothetical protein M413DRAFT_424975 [Hebeloma cylindrosporum]|uniref:G-protein coupled receptors family 1 profile domain-containing protein n=1 Tax=Hebeloma cylindrosporum TaxID=76867 RepID=A0A0C3BW77_HEBCY|nr:hypothetical protein M413DRAFT_424975 [Hebeloma cylindrosporum h7]